jgi:hypothetical protein
MSVSARIHSPSWSDKTRSSQERYAKLNNKTDRIKNRPGGFNKTGTLIPSENNIIRLIDPYFRPGKSTPKRYSLLRRDPPTDRYLNKLTRSER